MSSEGGEARGRGDEGKANPPGGDFQNEGNRESNDLSQTEKVWAEEVVRKMEHAAVEREAKIVEALERLKEYLEREAEEVPEVRETLLLLEEYVRSRAREERPFFRRGRLSVRRKPVVRFDPSVLKRRVKKLDVLTAREREVVYLIGQGYRNRDIAQALVISEHTVKNHISNIFQKLGVADRYELLTLLYGSETEER